MLINNKKDGFTKIPLPSQAQWSPVFAFITADFNQDNTTDILAAGNFYGVIPYEGRYDANGGTVIVNENNNVFKIPGSLQTGFIIDGEVRDIAILKTIHRKKIMAIARNNSSIKIYSLPGNTIGPSEK